MTQYEFNGSQNFDVFAVGNADAIRNLLVEKISEQYSNNSDVMFRARATALIGIVLPVLTWMRDNYGVPISLEAIRLGMELRSISTMTRHRIFRARNIVGGNPIEYKVPEMPEDLVYPLQAYLGELPGYDPSIEWNQQRTNMPAEQHVYALTYFIGTFTQPAVLRAAG